MQQPKLYAQASEIFHDIVYRLEKKMFLMRGIEIFDRIFCVKEVLRLSVIFFEKFICIAQGYYITNLSWIKLL